MEPIRSFQTVCRTYRLSKSQTDTLQSLISRRRGVLHPYWIQIALYVQYDFARRLYDELIANEWAIPDEEEANGRIYETELTDIEIAIIARLALIV